jgi:hydroxymethylpyrimidine/phosphomethylpyrimidine kinase
MRLVVVGGLDPGGGAGLVRDFLTARTLGAVPYLVPTAWTDQSPGGVRAIEPRDPTALEQALRGAVVAGQAGGRGGGMAVKIGMLPGPEAAAAVRAALAGFEGPVVLDPVLAASSGGALYRGDLGALVALSGRATLVTPNAGEAAVLGGGGPVETLDEAATAGQALVAAGLPAVLVKGGHLPGDEVVDLLCTAAGVRRFAGARVAGAAVRGTGCALATAIAVHLGRGLALGEAVAAGKSWLGAALVRAVDRGGERQLD